MILTSKPQKVNYYENAQPIRLQVLSMCNEMNYKIYLHYKICLYNYRTITCISKIKHNINWTPILEGVNTDSLKFREIEKRDDNYLSPSSIRNRQFSNYVIESFNDIHDFNIKKEPHQDRGREVDCDNQLGISYTPNIWNSDITIISGTKI